MFQANLSRTLDLILVKYGKLTGLVSVQLEASLGLSCLLSLELSILLFLVEFF